MLEEKFDLQLFAEDSVEQGEDTTPEETPEDVSEEDNQPDYYLDEDGNFKFKDEEEQPEDKPEDSTPEETKYKVKVNGKEKEVTLDELLNGYQRQDDYTRKTQELAEQRKQLEEQAKSTPQSKPEVQQETTPELKPKDHVEVLANTAMARARKVLELGEDEPFNEYNPKHLTAFNVELQNIYSEVSRQQAVQNQYQDLIDEYRQKEPEHFKEIDLFAQNRLHNELPMAKANEIINAVNTGKFAKVREFIEETRKLWYEQNLPEDSSKDVSKDKPKVQPPKVESAGSGSTQTQPKTRDMKDFRGKTTDDQVNQLIKWGLV